MFSAFLDQLLKIISSPNFLACIFSWFSAQFIKTIIKLFRAEINSIHDLLETLIWKTGNMPSSHSAIVACLCTTIAFSSGVTSDVFLLSLVFYLVTIRDAVGVRRANGIQAKALNDIGIDLKDKNVIENFKKLKEVQGHTPMEVFVGSLLGVFIGVATSVL